MEWSVGSRSRLAATVIPLAAFVLWTLWLPVGLDTLWPSWRPDPESASGELLELMAGATSPVVLFAIGIGAAWWASRRRLFNLAGAMLLGLLLSWATASVVKELVAKPRPDSPFAGIITQTGYSYPSAHVTSWTAAAVLTVAFFSALGKSRLPWVTGAAFAVSAVALNRLIMGAHSIVDTVGGLLLGLACAMAALLIADVGLGRAKARGALSSAAIIYNPVKVVGTDTFRAVVEQAFTEHGFEAIWLPTEADDPGVRMSRRALEEDVDLVLVAGGDGTVRVVLGELSGTGKPVAVLPSGTGNLLARNLGIPLDLTLAIRLALTGKTVPTDLVRTVLPDGDQFAAVLAGIGLDAEILDDTDEALKKAIGPAAYVVAGAKHLEAHTRPVRLILDEGEPIDFEACLVSVGNVGELQEGVPLFPDANAHDGQLDVLVATPASTVEMAEMVTDILGISHGRQVARFTGRKARLLIEEGAKCQIDGDVVGEVTDVTFEICPGAVQLVLP